MTLQAVVLTGGLSDHLNPHFQQPRPGIPNTRKRRSRQVNHPATHKRPSVIDANHHAFTVLQVGYLDLRAKGQGAVGCGFSAGLIGLAAGRLSVLEAVRVVGGLAGFLVPVAHQAGSRSGR